MNKDTFILKTKYSAVISKLSDKQAGVLFKMLFEYVENGANAGSTDERVDMAFEFIKMDLDVFAEKYEERKAINARNGAKGGAPVGNSNAQKSQSTEIKQNQPKQAKSTEIKQNKPNDNDNDNKTDINTPLTPQGELVGKIDFEKLIKFLNAKTGRDFKLVNDAVRKKYSARLQEGYTKEDILSAIQNAVQDPFHKENGFKFLTPEYFSRAKTLDQHSTRRETKAPKLDAYLPGPWN